MCATAVASWPAPLTPKLGLLGEGSDLEGPGGGPGDATPPARLEDAKDLEATSEEEILNDASGGVEGYIVSVVGRRRRLHYVGKCFRLPQIHYKSWEVLGLKLPAPELYTDICKDCWKDGDVQGAAADVSEVDSMEESSSTSEGSDVVQEELQLDPGTSL